MDVKSQPTRSSGLLIGVLCGTGAAFGWAAGFVAAKHGIEAGFTPADLAFHRYFWAGIFLLPVMLRAGIADLGGVGWGRGLVMSILSGPPQAFIAYSGFILVPLGHGTTIQPACAALFGIILATFLLRERMAPHRLFGAVAIIGGLLVFGAESLATIGTHGVGGDLLFVTAGCFWATFGILLRYWSIPGIRAVAAVGTFTLILMAPPFLLIAGYQHMTQLSWHENLVQVFVQGLVAGVLPIYLFSIAVARLGAGRASTFPALVPIFGLIIGFLTLGVVPTIPQLIGLVIVVIGFQFVVR